MNDDAFELYLRLSPPVAVRTSGGVRVFDGACDLFRFLEASPEWIVEILVGESPVHPVSVGALNAYRFTFGVGYYLRRIAPHGTRTRHNWRGLCAHLGMLTADFRPL